MSHTWSSYTCLILCWFQYLSLIKFLCMFSELCVCVCVCVRSSPSLPTSPHDYYPVPFFSVLYVFAYELISFYCLPWIYFPKFIYVRFFSAWVDMQHIVSYSLFLWLYLLTLLSSSPVLVTLCPLSSLFFWCVTCRYFFNYSLFRTKICFISLNFWIIL